MSNHQISLADAARFTANFQANFPDDKKAHCFSRDAFDELLSQPGASGISIYNAINDSNESCRVVVATDANSNDMLDLVMEMSMPCPPMCSIANELNHL